MPFEDRDGDASRPPRLGGTFRARRKLERRFRAGQREPRRKTPLEESGRFSGAPAGKLVEALAADFRFESIEFGFEIVDDDGLVRFCFEIPRYGIGT